MAYFFIFFVAFALFVFELYGVFRNRSFAIVVFFIELIMIMIIIGCSLNGADYVTYRYDYMHNYLFGKYEIGYSLGASVAREAGIDYDYFQFILVGGSILIIGIVLFAETNKPFSSIFIYLSCIMPSLQMAAVRQGCAIAFLFIVWACLNRKKIIYAIIAFILACSFHSSACIAILFFVFAKIRITPRKVFFIVMISSVFAVANIPYEAIGIAIKQLESLFGKRMLFQKAEMYWINNYGIGYIPGLKLRHIRLLFMLFFLSVYYKRKKNDSKYICSYNSILLSFLFAVLFDNIGEFSRRLPIYFEALVPYAFFSVLDRQPREIDRDIVLLISSIASIYMYSINLFNGQMHYFPYSTFLLN